MVFIAFLLYAHDEKNSMKQTLESLLVVSLGKALNKISSSFVKNLWYFGAGEIRSCWASTIDFVPFFLQKNKGKATLDSGLTAEKNKDIFTIL